MTDVSVFRLIRNHILRQPADNHVGLLQGAGGEALYLFYASKVLGDPSFAEDGSELLGRALDAIENLPSGPASFNYVSGIAGLTWTIGHLKREGMIDFDLDDLSVFDELHARMLEQNHADGFYDLTVGLVGQAYYYLDKADRTPDETALLERVVLMLCEMAKPVEGGYTWIDPPYEIQEKGKIIYNMGLAHGLPAAVVFLSKACLRGICADQARPLIDGAVSYILSCRIKPEAGLPHFFPSRIVDGVPELTSRLGWCYGDQGIALMLRQAAHVTGRSEWMAAADEIMLDCTKRKSYETTRLVDANLCHGTTGVAAMFKRYYWETGERVFRDAAGFWAGESMQYARRENDQLMFAYKSMNDTTYRYTGLLEGSAGCGLGLLSAASETPLAWDECMLMS